MTDMSELVLNRLTAEVQAHADTELQLDVALKYCSEHRAKAEGLIEQNETLGKKLIEAISAKETEQKIVTDLLSDGRLMMETITSLKAELTRLADQHQKTVSVLKDLANTIEAKFRGRKGQNMSPAFYAARSHLKLIEPL